FSSRRRHTRFSRDWSSDVCSSDLRTGRPRQAGMLGNYIGIYTTSPELGTSNANIWGSGRLYMLYAEGDTRRDRTLAPFIYSPSRDRKSVVQGKRVDDAAGPRLRTT